MDDWSPDLVEIEAREKEEAGCLLFVIDPATRALASIVEASEYICRGRHVILCILDVEEGTAFGTDGLPVKSTELKDLNRCGLSMLSYNMSYLSSANTLVVRVRSYLRDVATRHGVAFSDSVQKTVQTVIESHRINSQKTE